MHERIRKRLWRDVERLRAAEGYLRAGWPRFFSYFSRDACIAAWQLLDVMPRIARDALVFAAGTQGARFDWRNGEEPGKISHQAYGRGETPSFWDALFYGPRQYFAVDVTALWLILAHRYWKREGEAAVPVLRQLQPNLTAGLTWLLARIRRDGFLVYRKVNPLGFTHQGWRDGWRNHIKIRTPVALVDVQAYAYAALRGGAELAAECFAQSRFGTSYLEDEAEALWYRFNERFWWPEEGTYAFALAGTHLEQVRRIVPEPGMCLFSGIVPEHRIPGVVNRLFRQDLWTPYGLRSLSGRDPLFRPDSYHNGSVWPWQNWLVWLGLRSSGYTAKAHAIRDAMRTAFLALDGMPEAFAVTADGLAPYRMNANPVQAWSACALLAMLIADGGE